MPVKVHVKGKRKAPPPPIKHDASSKLSLADSLAKQNENQTTNMKINQTSGNLTRPNAVQNQKKQAPLPPLQLELKAQFDAVQKLSTSCESNNLSISKKTTDKFPEKNANFNIIKPKQIQNNLQIDQREASVQISTNKDGENQIRSSVTGRNINVGAENTQVWVCQHCSLENPFWKIVCAACEHIKPYGLPNLQSSDSNLFSAQDSSVNQNITVDNVNIIVKMRPHLENAKDGALLKRSSLNMTDIQPHANVSTELKPNKQTATNKRSSMIIAPGDEKKHEMSTLEMEKQRLRAVLRAMNNRALAAKYPVNLKVANQEENMFNNVRPNEHNYETIKTNNCDRENGVSCSEKILNGNVRDTKIGSSTHTAEPKKQTSNGNLLTDDAKANASLDQPQISVNDISTIRSTDKYYDFIGNLAMYCDRVPLGNTMKRLEADIVGKKEDDIFEFAAKVVEDNDYGNNLILNLYINFNNAIEIKVQHNMTLNELKKYISKNIAPCKNPKIYFNGLLMQKEEQTLTHYGIKEKSSLYINTENIVAVTRCNLSMTKIKDENTDRQLEKVKNTCNNTVNSNTAYNGLVSSIAASNQKEPPKRAEPRSADIFEKRPPMDEKYLIEHIQLNRFTIEKINPENVNISKTKYRGVYNYNPRCNPGAVAQIEKQHILNTKKHEAKVPQTQTAAANTKNTFKSSASEAVANEPPADVAKSHSENQYLELLTLDDSPDLALSFEAFECSICFVEYQPLEGIVLRNCLHTFCKDCIRNTIIYSEEAEVQCPYSDKAYACEWILQDREIKALLTKFEHDEHLAKSLRIAENKIENSFHCRTPNCKGWCIYEDIVNQFKCPICHHVNCLTCRVVHDGLNCKEYQDMMKKNLEKNPENAITLNMLDEMIKNDEAMNCPTCRVVLMKKWGCDWLKCSMCKTEICWVTRGPRWGPAGKGDTSGGCKCGIGGFRCHPKCNYCH